jgi:hypothetical protein
MRGLPNTVVLADFSQSTASLVHFEVKDLVVHLPPDSATPR